MGEHRSYTETERIPAMLIALERGGPVAARETGIPERTIYAWLDDAGGIAELRKAANERAGYAILSTKQAIADEMRQRAASLPDAELAETFRAMIREVAQQAPALAQASAAVILVQLQDGEVIEVPRGDATELP